MNEEDLKARLDEVIAEARRLRAAPAAETQRLAIQFIPEADKRTRMYILLGILIAVVCAYLFFKPSPKPAGQGYSNTTPIPELSKVPKVTLQGMPVQVYHGNPIPLPPGTPPETKVAASAKLAPSEGGYKAVATYLPTTGEVKIVAEEQPRPLFGLGGKTEVGVRVGFSTNGQMGAIYSRQDLLRIGGAHLAAYGEADVTTNINVKPSAKALLEISYRW